MWTRPSISRKNCSAKLTRANCALRWFGTDGLLMQRVTTDTRYDRIKLYSAPAQQLIEFIRADRRAVRQESEGARD